MLLYPSSSSIPWTTTAPQPCPRCNAAPHNPREPLRFENRSFSAPCSLPAASLSRIPQSKKPRSSFGHSIRCAAVGEDRKQGSRGSELQNPLYLKDYYEVLGVSVDASYDEIRKAYRRLQKKHHPDVTGDKGHAMTLLINEAYQTLISEDLRDAYKALHSERTANSGAINTSFTGFAFSSWRGPDRPQGIFVDENTCIGCRECVFHASKTFKMDEPSGCARVMTQWGDSETQIKVALEACPVNCIHYVEREDLPILEFLIRPQLKASNGVYGGGWERPSNVFMAARTFKRKLKSASHSSSGEPSWRQETPAQREARINADLKMRAGAFWWLWLWGTATNQQQGWGSKEPSQRDADKWSWKKLLGRSCTSEILTMPVDSTEVLKVISLVQEWAITFASSSELPLPMPFRADPLTNGVQLSLITTSNGLIESIGSLLVTVEEIPATEAAALGELFSRDVENSGTEENWWLRVKRQGKVGTRPLPGEGRIVQHLKDAIQGCDSAYMKYYLHRS